VIRPQIEASKLIMGFGHPVYQTRDPRSALLLELADSLGGKRVTLAKHVESRVVALFKELKPRHEIHTNVEFYAGVLLETCGIPRPMFTSTFATSRVIGWCANILEQAFDKHIIRPSAKYVGPPAPAPLPTAHAAQEAAQSDQHQGGTP
jgi:citrate synthase